MAVQKDKPADDLFAQLLAGAPPPPPAKRAHQTAMINGAQAWAILVAVVRILSVALVALSVLGTFYGVRGMSAPLLNPIRLLLDIIAAPQLFGLAALGQGLLSVIQWGSRWGAQHRARFWWVVYFLSLALSVWWNWQAYGATMVGAMGMPWLLALGVIIGSDVLPEFALVAD